MKSGLSPHSQFTRPREDQIVALINGKTIRSSVVDEIDFELRSPRVQLSNDRHGHRSMNIGNTQIPLKTRTCIAIATAICSDRAQRH